MIDVQTLNELIQREIAARVDQVVAGILDQESWMSTLEERIVASVQQRLIGRFNNIEQVPGLVDVVTQGVIELFDRGHIPGIRDLIDTHKIQSSLDSAVQQLVQASIDNLVLDSDWLRKIQLIIDGHMVSKVAENLSTIDLRRTISDTVNNNMEQWRERLAADVRRPGFQDTAAQLELTVMDGAVVVERNLVARDITVANTASVQGALTVQDLAVLGTVNVDNASWHGVADRASEIALRKLTPGWQQDLVQQVLELARTQGIDFDTVTMGGEPVVASGALNSNIRNSNLETVGVLQNLTATGTVKLGNTVTILPRRLGINTMEPEMALSIWDEEISVMMGKLSQDRAYIGTGRRQGLAFGIDRKVALEIESSGMVAVKQLRVDRWIIGHDKDLPGYSGTRGDIVFNHDPKPESPFAWICLGGFRWQPLKSAP
jgi:hypothetical protein